MVRIKDINVGVESIHDSYDVTSYNHEMAGQVTCFISSDTQASLYIVGWLGNSQSRPANGVKIVCDFVLHHLVSKMQTLRLHVAEKFSVLAGLTRDQTYSALFFSKRNRLNHAICISVDVLMKKFGCTISWEEKNVSVFCETLKHDSNR